MQKESQTAKAIQKAQEEKLIILKDEHTKEAIAQNSRICELENQMSDVQSRYNILAELSKEAKAEADKKIRTQSIEVKKMKADRLARSEALAKLSQQVKDEAEEKMKTQAYELEKLKSDWMASSILNTELSNEIDRLKRQRISDLSNEIDRLKMQHEQTTTVNDISVSAAAIVRKIQQLQRPHHSSIPHNRRWHHSVFPLAYSSLGRDQRKKCTRPYQVVRPIILTTPSPPHYGAKIVILKAVAPGSIYQTPVHYQYRYSLLV